MKADRYIIVLIISLIMIGPIYTLGLARADAISISLKGGNGGCSGGPGGNIAVCLGINPSTINIGQSVTFTATVKGGTPPYTYDWTGLPTPCIGLNINTITCNPETAGTYDVTITANDNTGIATDSSTLVVNQPPSLKVSLNINPSTINIGQSVKFTASVSGGTSPYTYSWTGLPTSCISSNTATITCNPNAAGTYNAGVTVIDSSTPTQTQTSTGTLIVNQQVLTTITISPLSPTLAPRQAQLFMATCYDQSGVTMTCPTITWSTSDSTLGTINTNGLFTALASSGMVTVSAAYGGVTASTTVTLALIPNFVSIVPVQNQINAQPPSTITFGVTTDQIVNDIWILDHVVQNNNSVNTSTYTATENYVGKYKVEVEAINVSNQNLVNYNIWNWNLTGQLAINSSTTSIPIGVPTNITFTATRECGIEQTDNQTYNNCVNISTVGAQGANITLSSSDINMTGYVTKFMTDANGQVNFTINPSNSGHITATATEYLYNPSSVVINVGTPNNGGGGSGGGGGGGGGGDGGAGVPPIANETVAIIVNDLLGSTFGPIGGALASVVTAGAAGLDGNVY